MEKDILQKGLTSSAARTLLKQYGMNEIKSGSRFVFIRSFLSQFNNFLTLLLIGAALVSFFLNDVIDGVFITLIIILNAAFGFYQEYKAEKALSLLKQYAITTVRLIRDRVEQELDSRLLVPGDIMYLEAGTRISADALVLASWHLEINEAALTGESMPVEKNSSDEDKKMIYLGTMIVKGRCFAQVTKTGMNTKFGTIAKTLTLIEEGKTPLQKKLEVFTKQIGFLGMIAALAVFVLSFIQEKTLFESFIFAVSLAVAVVPEGLPAVMTITLAIGVERMAHKKAIVRKLNAIEALGAVTLVATDKTGTLTTGNMRVKKIWVAKKDYDVHTPPKLTNPVFSKLLLNGILCSTASLVFKVNHGSYDVVGDPTEGAVLLLGQELGLIPQVVKNKWQVVDELPFDAVTKKMSVVVEDAHEAYVFTKGAPETVLANCSHILDGKPEPEILTDTDRKLIEEEFQQYAKKALRMIAFSYKKKKDTHIEADQIFLGFVGIADPVRQGVREAIQGARDAGIKVVMITGDNQLTAEAIGIETGIIKSGEDMLTGQQLDEYSDEQILGILPKVKIFARTTPQHKYRLVKLYQQINEIVAVTGDGVNDALALKQADVGVAMGLTGTDVAKETADVVITDDNFASLISALEQGRNIFNHIKNSITFLLSCNLGEVLYIFAAIFFGLPVLTPLQILYVNLVTDGLPAISFAFSPYDKDVMTKQPRKSVNLLERVDYRYIVFIGILTALLVVLSVLPFLHIRGTAAQLSVIFTSIILIQHFVLIDSWLSHRPFLKYLHLLLNPVFLSAFFIPILIHPLLLYNPYLINVFGTHSLNAGEMIYAIGISFGMLLIIEIFKRFR